MPEPTLDPAQIPVPTPPTPTPPSPPVDAPAPSNIEGYRALVEKLRTELKDTKADRTPQDEKDAKAIATLKRQLAEVKSPEDVRQELAQSIGKALGLVKDEPLDPAKLTEELTASQSAAKQARVELAVYRAAGAVKGDPSALLDSTSFLRSLDGIDPSDTAAVQAAITTAVAANPRLGAAPTDPKIPAPNPAQGAGGGGAPDRSALIAAAQKAGDWKTVMALENQKLAVAQPKQ